MESGLPINIRDLLHCRGIEQTRVEFKASWKSEQTAAQVVETLCAFANDFQNINGGYVVIGVKEENGRAMLPPAGLDPAQIERIQKDIRVLCKTRIDPEYQPYMSPELVDGRHILVLWAPGSDMRPHSAPASNKEGQRAFYIRVGPENVEAKKGLYTQLMQMTAKVPFDDRKATAFALADIRSALVREFLHDVGSALVDKADDVEIYRRMRLTARMNGHEAPRNIALLFFSDDPERAFPGARIEVAQFADDAGGDMIEETVFRGPVAHQLRRCIDYLRNFTTAHVQKLADRADAKGWVSYPLPALEEVLVNAVYHRSYEGTFEPTKVHLYPDRIEITNYPGPVPGLAPEHFLPGAKIPPVPARNRRIGEMLKELRLAEQRGTGIPKVHRAMHENGSPQPRFSFDDARTYFQVTLPAHPEYVAVAALRDVALLDAVGNTQAAERRLHDAFANTPGSGVLAAYLIQRYIGQGNLTAAQTVFDQFQAAEQRTAESRPLHILASAYLKIGRQNEARRLLDRLPAILSAQDAIELAIQERRAGREKKAHSLFERAGEAVWQDSRALLEFAQAKSWLARSIRGRSALDAQARERLYRDARDMLRRVLQLDDGRMRHAWAWFELGHVLRHLQAPHSEVEAAFRQAYELAPEMDRFARALAQVSSEHEHARPPRRR